MNGRILVFDNIKYFLMVLVIYAHLMNIGCDIPWDLYKFIYSFHMPLFVMVSGYFTNRDKNAGDFFRANRNLGALFLIFSLVAACVNVCVYHKPAFDSIFVPQFALWYLLCLIYWRTLVYCLPTRVLKSLLFTALVFAISLLPSFFHLNYFALSRCLAFFPFFLVGWLCRENQWLSVLDKWRSKYSLAFVLGSVACYFVAIKIPPMVYWGFETVPAPAPAVLLYKLGAWCVAFVLSITVYLFMPKNVGVEEGKYTLFYYLYHTVLLFPFFDYAVRYLPHHYLTSLLVLVCLMATLFVLRKVRLLSGLLRVGR